ncbi:MAG: adenylate kinase [Parachlamydiales bacterium]|nr:adenylate kinase [Parachlamydiales bacterium]
MIADVNYILVGPCGAGKSTIMEYFRDRGFMPISTSNLIRAEMQNGGPHAALIQHCAVTADNIPDDIVFSIVKSALHARLDRCFVMESFPYNLAQWTYLKEWLFMLGILSKKVHFIYLDSDLKTSVERLGGRLTCSKCFRVYQLRVLPPKTKGKCDACHGPLITREQDNPETIRRRFDRFESLTKPILLDAARSGYQMVTIDAKRFWSAEPFFQELSRQGVGLRQEVRSRRSSSIEPSGE